MFTNTCRWEGTVAARKILVVVIGVFGSGMGDLQVHFMALLVVIIVLVTVYVRPHGRLRILYVLEMTSLVVLFLTLWAGMVFNSRPRCADGTGSTLPWCDFISVVIGIMNVFLNITSAGGSNIMAVAPGVGQALITTVAGLFVAIPAVIAYNHFVSQLNLVSGELEGFSSEFIGTLARESRV